MAEEQLYRKESLDKISSPEQLDSYVKVMPSGSWIFIIAILCLLVGFTCWGIFGKLHYYVNGVAKVEENLITSYVKPEEYKQILDNQKCFINGTTFIVCLGEDKPIKVDETFDQNLISSGNFSYGEYVNVITFENKELKAGIYSCEFEIKEISPFSFLIN